MHVSNEQSSNSTLNALVAIVSWRSPAQSPIILDLNAERDRVLALLGKLQNQMGDLQKQAFTYKSYQKNFKVRCMCARAF